MSDAAADNLHLDVNDLAPEDGVSRLLEHAATLYASDVFFTANEKHIAVGLRHLGMLRLVSVIPSDLGRRCIAHIKAVAGMDVAEKRRPLDGRCIYQRENGQAIDLRINTLPTLYGEDVTLRLLDRDNRLLDIDHLGLMRRDYNEMLNLLNSPSGLVLVTGPTGSGKTTTLYACLAYLNNGERKINTIEDPVEYAVAGIRQSQVNPKIELDFPEMLRGVLRQGPDVIMIGEVRDPATAETAVRAANSGHLVLATLHAPVAAGAIQSMLSLGVHPHFLASSLLGVIAQRLVRTLCPECKKSFEMDESMHTFDEVARWLEPGQGQVLHGPAGCAACHMTGYAGRTGVFEVLTISRAIRPLILQRQPIQTIRDKGVEEGMIEFKHSALLKVARGETSVEEVFRAVPSEYLGVEE
jgi:type II secretory ATPase GspE/PulE/Tfp pilus assembly ATPase PilB-like protein